MAKKHKHEEHENHERWLVSYADFITLLFAFFVVLYASSTQSESKAKEAENSIRSSFHMIDEGGGGPDLMNLETGAMIAPFGEHKLTGSPIDMQRFYQKQIEHKMSEEERGKAIQEIDHDLNGVRIRLVDTNLFQPGSAELNQESMKALSEILDTLKKSRQEIMIEGHTDNQPVSGQYTSNWELGAQRAVSIVRYLIEKHNFNKSKLGAISYGDTRPLVSNESAEGRARNRRIEFYILSKETRAKGLARPAQ
jgi:chemotaxis protein MotB